MRRYIKSQLLAYFLLVVCAVPPCSAGAASWSVRVDEQGGLPVLSRGGADAMTASFVFWGSNWSWADLPTTFKIIAPFKYEITGKNKELDFDLRALVTKVSERQLKWSIDLDAHSRKESVIGGGLSFNFDIPKFGAELGEPELLPNNSGWVWGEGANRIEMRFDPPLASLHFERGRKNEIRAYFYNKFIPEGPRHITATLTAEKNVSLTPTVNERLGLSNMSEWTRSILDWRTAPVDLSFLNVPERPAGKHGFLHVKGDSLVFEDGTPARFWGTNLTAYALFGTPKEAVRQQAKRLSALGFNLVRIHHHDSPWVNPNVFGDGDATDTRILDPAALDKLDWWIKCLEDEGIYVWLDLQVGRRLTAGDDIYGFDEIRKDKPTASLRGYNYVNLSIKQAMKEFNAAYLNHYNPYTGTTYKNEPAIIAVLITNENDVTHHFGNALLPDKNVPKHNRLYMDEASAFAHAHGLPANQTWPSWEPGPSKLFLNDLEHRFNVDMIEQLRELGVKVPIVTTSTWGDNPLSSLPALTDGDIIDVHSYGSIGALKKNPLIAANLIDWMAAAQVVGKPVSVTEWNATPFPTPDRHTLPLYVAAQARLQGWDALMQYAYSQTPLNGPGRPSNWDAFNDPALMATMPAAALIYRQDDISEASTTYVLAPDKNALFYQAITPANSPAIRTATELGKLLIAMPKVEELPWLQESVIPAGATIIRDPGLSLLSEGAAQAVSRTGELHRNWDKGFFTINTPRTQAAMGWIGDEELALDDVQIVVTTRNATVAVQSLDTVPIRESQNLLISLAARSVPSKGNKLPFRSEPIKGRLTIRAPEGLRLYDTRTGQELQQADIAYENGWYVIKLDESVRTYWLALRPAEKARALSIPSRSPR